MFMFNLELGWGICVQSSFEVAFDVGLYQTQHGSALGV